MPEKRLTKEVLRPRILSTSRCYISSNFSRFTELDDDAAESLCKHKKGLWLNGLTSLSDAAAESLSKHKGDRLSLSGLTSLSDAAAESLSKHKGDRLSLSGLTSLSDAAAESLSEYKGWGLYLDLDELPESAAEILRQHWRFQDDE